MKAIILSLTALIVAVVAEPQFPDNDIAGVDVVYKIPEQKFQPKCKVEGRPLDLLFLVDASGSMKDYFEQIMDKVKVMIGHVAVGKDATRVALIQFSTRAHTEFQLNELTYSKHVIDAFSRIRPTHGLTYMAKGINHVTKELNATKGMRGPEVKKIVLIISDGKTHDHPQEVEAAEELRKKYPDLDLYAYGYGKYPDFKVLAQVTGDEKMVFTDAEFDNFYKLFADYKGVEICEKVPICIPGSDKPLDLLLVIDGSNSVTQNFEKQKNFVINEIVNRSSLTIHPKAVRVAVIVYGTEPRIQFEFNRYIRREPMIRQLRSMTAPNGTTDTSNALRKALGVLLDLKSGVRDENVKKLVIVFTDGHSKTNPNPMAKRLLHIHSNVTIFAVGLLDKELVSRSELVQIAIQDKYVFMQGETTKFHKEFINFYGFKCPGMPNHTVNPDDAYIRGPIQQTCTTSHVTVEVRVQKPFNGHLFATDDFSDPNCVVKGTGKDTSIKIILKDGTCGIKKIPSLDGKSSNFTGQLTLQFHKDVMTRADKTIVINCPNESPVPETLKDEKPNCGYTIHRHEGQGCIILDLMIGYTIYHKWDCQLEARHMRYLVHDCYAVTRDRRLPMIDTNGCSVDPILLETPSYEKQPYSVVQRSAVFKFRESTHIRFECKISICDMERKTGCEAMIPPKGCPTDNRNPELEKSKTGFQSTIPVETREMNVLLSSQLKSRASTETFCTGTS